MGGVLLLTVLSACVLAAAATDCTAPWCLSAFSYNFDIPFFEPSQPLPQLSPSTEELIRQSGYPVETHEIRTEDGYLLTYHRIPRSKDSTSSQANPVPVLLQHGLLTASSSWVLSEQCLAFSLADAGYDVWLGNSRGNTYSRKHVKWDPDIDKKIFWDFSWHEMGYYDLPAAIDYILQETGRKKIVYVGHSMGTTMYFVLGATRKEYMTKVEAAFLLAPVAYLWNMRSPLANFFTKFNTIMNLVFKTFGVYEVLPYSNNMLWIDRHICALPGYQFICRDILFYIGGFNEQGLNRTMLPKILEYVPAGASYKQFRHFRQLSENGTEFQQYDYGFWENMWQYDQRNPPTYNLSNVIAPTYVYYSENDWLAVPEDVLHTVQRLPNVRRLTKVDNELFNHLDFMWGLDAKSLVYDDIISTLHSIRTNK